MAQKRPKGAKNYLYLGVRGTEITAAGALTAGKFYKITAIASSSSGLPATSKVGDVIYVSGTGITLVSGDKVIPFTLEKVAFVTNVPHSLSKEKFEDTTQVDDAKNYAQGDKSDIGGSMEGYFLVPTTAAELTSDNSVAFLTNVLNRFLKKVVDGGTGKTGIVFTDVQTGFFDFFL
jgi:hypothetical protein